MYSETHEHTHTQSLIKLCDNASGFTTLNELKSIYAHTGKIVAFYTLCTIMMTTTGDTMYFRLPYTIFLPLLSPNVGWYAHFRYELRWHVSDPRKI